MATVNISEDNFARTIQEGIVLIDFWAEWCGPCRSFSRTYEAASERHADVVFGKVDTDEEHGLAAAFKIRALPTLVVLRDGILLAAEPGMLSPLALDDLIGKVKALDMNEVRRQLQQEQQPASAMGGV